MFYQIFLSLPVKRCAIFTYRHGMYELPHELPNDLRLRKLGNIWKVSNSIEDSLVPSLPAKMKVSLIQEENS